jgi:dipeptidyl aminopeptidase/acylaminoacyl peptidase
MSQELWQKRFTVPTVSEVRWAGGAPDRLGVVSTEDGSSQAWAWDLATDRRTRASSAGVGAEEVHVLPDGSGVVWWQDATGDERGRWLVTPFDNGEPMPLVPGLPDGWMMGISLVPGVAAIGLADDEGYGIHVSDSSGTREVHRSKEPAGVGLEWPQGFGGLSPDGALLCIRHSEEGEIIHQALRVLDTRSGAVVADLRDPGMAMQPMAWSQKGLLAFVQERGGIERPGIWDPVAASRSDLELPDIDGPVTPVDWFPGGRELLLHRDGAGCQQLIRHDVETGKSKVVLEAGTIEGAAIRPDGQVWSIQHSSVRPPEPRNLAGESVISLGQSPPEGTPYRAISFPSPGGPTIDGYVVTPPGAGPFPTIVSVHGGPEWHHTDGWDPGTQAFVDSGFAALLINYRGSTGRGREFRDSLQGNIGFPESEDINAGLDHAIALGIADPANVFLEGWSWGGYLATLNAGIHPQRWRAVVAGIPVGDYVASHYECAQPIRDWDIARMGGSPMDLPELYRERNPMTYVDRVTAPMLLIAGERDSRCPLGQVMTYAHALRARNHPVEVELYAAGHHANQVSEQVHQTELTIAFFRRHMV